MVAFNSIPSALRVPFVVAEIDSSRAGASPGPQPYRALILGQKLGSGTAAVNSLHKVTNADAVATIAGRGSMLHRQAMGWFAANKSTELWVGVLADNPASVVATKIATLSGTATAAGTLSIYLAGHLVEIPVASGDTAATVAAALATEIGKHAFGTVTFVTPGAGDNVTIGATTFVGTAGAVTLGAATYSVDTDATAAAASLRAQVNAHAVASTVVRASSTAGVVTIRTHAGGLAGNSVVLATTDAVNAAISGATLSGATVDHDHAYHATVVSGAITLHARNAGEVANQWDVRVNYRPDSESTPLGLEIVIAANDVGTTAPSLTAMIAAMGDTQYHVITHPYTDATSLTAIENELASRFGPLRMIDGVAITARNDTYGTLSTLGDSRNSQHSCILRTNESPTPPAEYAAHVAAVVAYYGQIDPARPFQTLPLPFILAPAEGDRDTMQERNLLLYDGISTTRVGFGDLVQIERLITTSQRNAAGSPDVAYLDLNTLLTLAYARSDFRSRMATKYPRHKLGNDSGAYPPGEAIMTPALGKAEAVSWFLDMATRSPVVFDPSALDQFKADLVVVRNADVNRLDFLLPPDLINQLIVSAAQIQFIL